MASPAKSVETACPEANATLHEEINRLPGKYRDAVVVCYLNGQTNAAAAGQLGCPLGTVKIRLTRAREILRARLTRRGVGLATAALTILEAQPATAALPAALRDQTLQAVALQMAGKLTARDALSGPALRLLHGTLAAMARTKIKIAAAILVTVSLIGAASGVAFRQKAEPEAVQPERAARAAPTFGATAPSAVTAPFRPRLAPPAAPLQPLRVQRLVEDLPPGALARIGTLRLRHEDFVYFVNFSADGKTLVSASPRAVRLWKMPTGEPIGELRMPADYTLFGEIVTADGKLRALSITNNEARLTAEWDDELQDRSLLSARRPVTAVVRGDRLHIVDVVANKEIGSIPTPPQRSNRPPALSADGRLVAGINLEGVYLWDLATGKALLQIKPEHAAASLAFAPDGKTLAVGSYAAVHLYELPSGKELSSSSAAPVRLANLAFSQTADTLASVTGTGTVHIWERSTGKELSRFETEGRGHMIASAFSADGQTLATMRGGPIIVWDVATGKKRYPIEEPQCFAFAPDGKTLITAADRDLQTVSLWDVSTGKRLRRLAGPSVTPKPAEPDAIEFPLQHFFAYSPDGKTVAAGGNLHNKIYLWDVATGVCLRELPAAPGAGLAFTADGRALMQYSPEGISMWEVATGKRRVTQGAADPIMLTSWSVIGSLAPNGRALAVAAGDFHAPTIQLLDVRTRQTLDRLAGHRGALESLTFSQDGKYLASTSRDGTALIWDVAKASNGNGREPSEPAALEPADLQRCWADLAEADAARAYRAVRALIAAPDQSLPFLRERLRPAPAADLRPVDKWIGQLASNQFDVRQKATAELEKVGLAARPALQAALAGKPALEVYGRLQRLLERAVREVPGGEQLRNARALEVLEGIGSPAGRPLLEDLSNGAPRAELTQQAQAALTRLSRRLTD
jgi:WD40 repeat protein